MPFDSQQFLDVFAHYNGAVFPAQIILLIAALFALGLAANGGSPSSKVSSAILAALWLWIGVVYHWIFFSSINGLAFAFGGLFVVQSAVTFHAGVIGNTLTFGKRSGARKHLGTFLIVYSILVYPLTGLALGHTYPYSPTFGLPCPSVLFTFGLLVRSGRRVPTHLLPIPFLWSLIALSGAYLLGMWEDVVLFPAALIGTWLLIKERASHQLRARTT